jgi:hypothetical protein
MNVSIRNRKTSHQKNTRLTEPADSLMVPRHPFCDTRNRDEFLQTDTHPARPLSTDVRIFSLVAR